MNGVGAERFGHSPQPYWRPGLTADGLICRTWPTCEDEVYYHRRMVAACRYARVVQVFHVPHVPVTADPDGVETPSCARGALPSPSPVRGRKGSG